MLHIVINFIMVSMVKLLAEVKSVSLIEKALIVIFFLIPCPGTCEAYLILSTLVKKAIKSIKSKKAVVIA